KSGERLPIRGWISAHYGQRRPAPTLVYSANVALPFRILTVLLPDAQGLSSPPPVRLIYDDEDRPAGLIFERPGESVRVDERAASGGDLQAAIDGASPGDLIALEPGATYHGPFRLPRKDGSGWIAIASASNLPGRRVGPSDAPRMAKLVASSGSVVVADASAH